MYLPSHFREERVPVLHAAMRAARLATLVTAGPDGLDASHVPLLLDPEPAPLGTLRGHLARANPQCGAATADAPALAIFQGPDAYVSPSWYATKRATGEVVPTWNYVVVHAHGRVRFFDDPARLLALVTELTARHEAGRPEPWSVRDAPEDYVRRLLENIVGVELTIERLEGKWKLGQNRSAADRAGAVEGLLREGGLPEVALAEVMLERG